MASAASADERPDGGSDQTESRENLISNRNLNSQNPLESSPGLSPITERSHARGIVVESDLPRAPDRRGSGFMICPSGLDDIFVPRGKM